MDLGSSGSIPFEVFRNVASANLSFNVPTGMTPKELRATLELPVDLRFGSLTVRLGDKTISQVNLPPRREIRPANPGAQPSAADGTPTPQPTPTGEVPALEPTMQEIVIPLTGTPVYGSWVSLSLTMTALGPDNYCWDSLTPIRLLNGSISFDGKETPPTSVAKFLPGVLRAATIAVPNNPSRAESDAAVQLAAEITMRYGGQSPSISVVPLSDGATALPPSRPLERQFIIREGPETGISLVGPDVPALLISGPGPELTNQVRLLGDEALQYALESKVIAPKTDLKQELVPDKTTLKELKLNGLKGEDLWPRVRIELDQTKFGHPIDSFRVHLMGSYTPLPDNFGGEVLVMADSTVIDRWPTEPKGIIDRWVAVPHELINRSTNLSVTVHTDGDPGHCGDYLPMDLRIDEASEVEATPSVPPTAPYPPGFQSLPQTLMPRVTFGIGADTFGDTARAADIAAGLQQMSSAIPLATTVTSLKEALESPDPAVLVSSDGWDDKNIGLPFSVDKETVTVQATDPAGEAVTLTVEPAMLYGSLQTVFDGNRTLLVATSNGAPQQIDQLLQWLNGERGRWQGINGRALISTAGSSEPVTVPNPPADLSTPTGGGTGSHSTADLIWTVAGGLAGLAVIGALFIVFRTRRRPSMSTNAAVADGIEQTTASHRATASAGSDEESPYETDEPESDEESRTTLWERLRWRKGRHEEPEEETEGTEGEVEPERAQTASGGAEDATRPIATPVSVPTRFHATKKLNLDRVVREVHQINEDVISQFVANDVPVRIRIDIDSDDLGMMSDEQRAALRDNLRALGFADGDWSMD